MGPYTRCVQKFEDTIKGRLESIGFGEGKDDKYLDQVMRAFQKAWYDLLRWVEVNSSPQNNRRCVWTRKIGTSTNPQELAWGRQTDDEDRDGSPVISSLRDVADEIPVARSFKSEMQSYGYHRSSNKIPEQYSPRIYSIWEGMVALPNNGYSQPRSSPNVQTPRCPIDRKWRTDKRGISQLNLTC